MRFERLGYEDFRGRTRRTGLQMQRRPCMEYVTARYCLERV